MGRDRGRGDAPAARATASDTRRRVRASKVLARNGTRMHTTVRPGAVKRTVFAPNRRMLRMPLKMRTVTRAGFDVTTRVRTHFERRSDPSEIRPGTTAVAGPTPRVRGLGITAERSGAGGRSAKRRIRGTAPSRVKIVPSRATASPTACNLSALEPAPVSGAPTGTPTGV